MTRLFIEIGDRSFNPLDVSRARWSAGVAPISGDNDPRVVSGEVAKDDNGAWRWTDEYDFFHPSPACLTVFFTSGATWDFEGDEAHRARAALREVMR